MTAAPPLLACRGLTRRFGGLTALDRLTLELEAGRILGLIGPNGSGKTTFFNVLTGIYRPTAGEILFAGEPLTGAAPRAVYAAGITRTFQRSRLCLPLTVFDNVMVGNHRHLAHGLRFNVLRRGALRRQFEEAKARTHELLRTFDAALADRMFDVVAGVPMIDRRRIEICRALVSRPRLLLLDEPSMGLSPIMVDKIFEVVADIAAQGVTVLLVEQNAHRALQMAQRGYVMDTGRITLEGPAQQLLDDPKVREAYLGL